MSINNMNKLARQVQRFHKVYPGNFLSSEVSIAAEVEKHNPEDSTIGLEDVGTEWLEKTKRTNVIGLLLKSLSTIDPEKAKELQVVMEVEHTKIEAILRAIAEKEHLIQAAVASALKADSAVPESVQTDQGKYPIEGNRDTQTKAATDPEVNAGHRMTRSPKKAQTPAADPDPTGPRADQSATGSAKPASALEHHAAELLTPEAAKKVVQETGREPRQTQDSNNSTPYYPGETADNSTTHSRDAIPNFSNATIPECPNGVTLSTTTNNSDNNLISLQGDITGKALFSVCRGRLIWVQISNNAATLIPAKDHKYVKGLRNYSSEKAVELKNIGKKLSDINIKSVAFYKYPGGNMILMAREDLPNNEEIKVWSKSELGISIDTTTLLRKPVTEACQNVLDDWIKAKGSKIKKTKEIGKD